MDMNMGSTTTGMDMPSSTSGAMDHGGMDHGGMDHGGMDHGGMDMGMGSGGRQCKVSMLFNINTIGSCFLSDQWYIETNGQFAGACIATIVLVTALEGLRRAAREYDRFLVNQHLSRVQAAGVAIEKCGGGASSDGAVAAGAAAAGGMAACAPVPSFRPTVLQQAIRSFLHMLQFGTAYIVMLLAMYYNGYIFVCILIGAYIGNFAFNWERMITRTPEQGAGVKDATVCCG